MKIVFVDETGVPKTGFFGVAAVMVDATKYSLLADRLAELLANEKWRPEYEFKGKAVFSAKSGDPDVTVDRRVRIVTELFNEFRSKSNSRIGAAVLAWNTAGDTTDNYEQLLGHALRMLKVPKKQGKNLVVVICDEWKTKFDTVSVVVRAAMTDIGGRILEDVSILPSRSHHAGLAVTDLLAYFLAWQNKNDDVAIFQNSQLPEKNARIAEWCESLATVKTKEFAPGTPLKVSIPSKKKRKRKRRTPLEE